MTGLERVERHFTAATSLVEEALNESMRSHGRGMSSSDSNRLAHFRDLIEMERNYWRKQMENSL